MSLRHDGRTSSQMDLERFQCVLQESKGLVDFGIVKRDCSHEHILDIGLKCEF